MSDSNFINELKTELQKAVGGANSSRRGDCVETESRGYREGDRG